jgi:hypothetical protein
MKFLDQLMHMTKSNRKDTQYQQPVYRTPEIMLNNISDRVGLEKAYAADNKVYVHGDTLFVAGTQWNSASDWWDDFTKIPFHQTWRAQRYLDADRTLKNNPQIKNLVGHSLGGSVVLELQNDHPNRTFKTDTYGAPELSITRPDNEDNHRYRNFLDPVSLLDGGASTKPQMTLNPLEAHSYEDFNINIEKRGYDVQTDFVDLDQ